MKEYRKIIFMFVLVTCCALLVHLQSVGQLSENVTSHFIETSAVTKDNEIISTISESNIEGNIKTLVIYDGTDEISVSAKDVFVKNLNYMKMANDTVNIDDAASIDYSIYKNVISIVPDLEGRVGSEINRILSYVEGGGNFLLGITPSEQGDDNFDQVIYNKLGIDTIYGYEPIIGMKFLRDVIPGTKGREFVDEEAFGDYCLNIKLSDSATVYMTSQGDGDEIPMLWKKDFGQGAIVCYNGTSLGGDTNGGLFAGALSILQGDFMYPIINAKVIFIDDFPAPQYNSESDVISNVYNRTVKEFFRDIWWPDMQKVANKYNYIYTGLFISTYNNIVDPNNFIFEDDPMMKYYGNSLLKNNYELGLHGYNHQSLALDGQTPEDVGYVGWANQEDMEASLKTLSTYAAKLFPGMKFTSYVPPSNYLSKEGRQALRNALPDLKVISGLYSDSTNTSYVQNFEVAEDGITEFPRITSGMWFDDDEVYTYLNGLGLHGVFSHFLHPDDILDEERGRGKEWSVLLEGYEKILEDVNKSYGDIRSLKASDTAEAVGVFQDLKVNLNYGETEITGACDNFYGEAFFYLKTEKTPKNIDESCSISKLGEDGYYLVTVKNANFTISLQ